MVEPAASWTCANTPSVLNGHRLLVVASRAPPHSTRAPPLVTWSRLRIPQSPARDRRCLWLPRTRPRSRHTRRIAQYSWATASVVGLLERIHHAWVSPNQYRPRRSPSPRRPTPFGCECPCRLPRYILIAHHC